MLQRHEKVKVYNYIGKVERGGFGYYIDFATRDCAHYRICKLLQQKHHISFTDISLRICKHDRERVDFYCYFPEFKRMEDLERFLKAICPNLKNSNKRFVDINFLLIE